ncbi:MAG: hypothetical protein KatS3mg105_2113 [Gemmatales bacterium]|nr:MAG: hypothetical protein KatS3mg105_2113 [Gemmatales bacterium]
MPLFAFVFAHLLVSDPHLRAGVILVGCVPGAMASNVLTLMARGNVSYSISLTTTATLLSPFVVPASLYYLLQTVARIDPWEVFVMLMLTVVLPVTAGFFLCQINGRAAGVMKRFGPTAAHLSILWVIAVVVARNRERFDLSGTVLLTLLAVNVAGYLVGYFGGACLKLPEAMRRALTIEIGMQNAGLGSVLANELFASEPRTAIPPVVYTVGCMFTGTLLARWWAGREICDASKSN